MLGHRLRRWPNIDTPLEQHLLYPGDRTTNHLMRSRSSHFMRSRSAGYPCKLRKIALDVCREFISVSQEAHSLSWVCQSLYSSLHNATYIGIRPYHMVFTVRSRLHCTLLQFELQCMTVLNWSCEKIQTFFIFRATLGNKALVQRIRCSPKGSHLIYWTSAVFLHISLKWTPLAYLMVEWLRNRWRLETQIESWTVRGNHIPNREGIFWAT